MDVVTDFSVFMEGFKRSFENFRCGSGVFEEIEPFLLGSQLCHIFLDDGFVSFWKSRRLDSRRGFSAMVRSTGKRCRRSVIIRGEGLIGHFAEFMTMGVSLVDSHSSWSLSLPFPFQPCTKVWISVVVCGCSSSSMATYSSLVGTRVRSRI